jgi:hypothetical protein
MEPAIVRKLRDHLSVPMDSECKAVYLLCEIRKLFDYSPLDPTNFALPLYCHWALHVNLSYPSTTFRFLQRVDECLFSKLNGRETNETIIAEHNLFRDFVYLETFRAELKQFLTAHGLPTTLCDEDEWWHTFLAAYAGVIEDGSISCEGKRSDNLKIVERVTFLKGRAYEGGHVPFGMVWDILLKNGKRVEVEVATDTKHGFMRSGIRLFS